MSPDAVARLLRIRAYVEPFLADCLRSVRWADYTLVGFTSVFQQNVASLALAARVKQARPEITIAFGGANWEDAMGVARLVASGPAPVLAADEAIRHHYLGVATASPSA